MEVQQREVVRVVLHCCGNVTPSVAHPCEPGSSPARPGKGVQPVLHAPAPAPLHRLPLTQDHAPVLALGLSPRARRDGRRRRRSRQEPARRRRGRV
jgi:hypothetical protein